MKPANRWANYWAWGSCHDWRERVCRLRDQRYAAAFVAHEEHPTAATLAVVLRLAANIIAMSKVRGFATAAEMISQDMPALARHLAIPFYGVPSYFAFA